MKYYRYNEGEIQASETCFVPDYKGIVCGVLLCDVLCLCVEDPRCWVAMLWMFVDGNVARIHRYERET